MLVSFKDDKKTLSSHSLTTEKISATDFKIIDRMSGKAIFNNMMQQLEH
jgi:hypothetical protein